MLKIYRGACGGRHRSKLAFLIKPLPLSLSFTDTHTFIFDKSCADVHLDASLPAKGVWGTAGSLQASGTYQYSKEVFLNRTGWEKKESKSNVEARRHRANKKHLVGRYLTAAGGRFPGDSVSSFTPNSSSNVCSNGSEIVSKVTPRPKIQFPPFLFFS